MSIEQLKKKLESEREEMANRAWGFEGTSIREAGYYKRGHEAATNRLLPLLEKAIEMAEFYSAEENLVGSTAGPNGPWDYSKVDLDRGKKAREFLAEIKKEFGK